MDIIYECAQNFINLLNTQYIFTVSRKRQTQQIILDFTIEDFRHASGLHYIKDINIERNPSLLVDSILSYGLTDAMLENSYKYNKNNDNYGSIKERVAEMKYLEKYLDESTYMRIHQAQDFGSMIDADYFIESTINENQTAYIFIRKRTENNNFVVVSFFPKYRIYRGGLVYWLEKIKNQNGNIIELNKNEKYIK